MRTIFITTMLALAAFTGCDVETTTTDDLTIEERASGCLVNDDDVCMCGDFVAPHAGWCGCRHEGTSCECAGDVYPPETCGCFWTATGSCKCGDFIVAPAYCAG